MISSEEATGLRQLYGETEFPHLYTRIPYGTTVDNEYNQEEETPGVPQPSLVCKYIVQTNTTADQEGPQNIFTPTLEVPYDSALTEGDRVSDITDRGGVLLLGGPALVESVTPVSETGFTLKKVALLRAADVRRT